MLFLIVLGKVFLDLKYIVEVAGSTPVPIQKNWETFFTTISIVEEIAVELLIECFTKFYFFINRQDQKNCIEKEKEVF